MAPPREFTLGDLAHIALGGSDFNEFHINVLHSLTNIILKKVGCENETISVSCTGGLSLENMLSESCPPPFQFDESRVTRLQPKFERLDRLEKSSEKTRERLESHMRVSNEFDQMPKLELAVPNNAEFILSGEESQIACYLTNDIDFLCKLQRRIALPLVLQLFEIERDACYLNDDMTNFFLSVKNHNSKIALLDACVNRLEALKISIENNRLKFIGTMEEVQDLFEMKFEKVHVPALKQFVKTKFAKMDHMILELGKDTDCTKASGAVMHGLRCMSCGTSQVAMERGTHRLSMLPDANPFKPKIIPKDTTCSMQRKDTNLAQVTNLHLTLDDLPKERGKVKEIKSDYCIPVHSIVLESGKVFCFEKDNASQRKPAKGKN